MTTRVVLLRAVNVGGATLPMARLKALAADLGGTDLSTYIASGNLLVDVAGDPGDFDRALEQAVQTEFGFFREAISRSPAELAAALAAHPFEVIEPKFSFITFLTAEPEAAAIARAEQHPTGDDRWSVVGAQLHIRHAEGAGRPQMNVSSVVRSLGTPGTARNLNTVRKLIALTT